MIHTCVCADKVKERPKKFLYNGDKSNGVVILVPAGSEVPMCMITSCMCFTCASVALTYKSVVLSPDLMSVFSFLEKQK